MHPIELLRHLARSGGRRRDQRGLGEQAVYGLMALAEEDPAAMVMACRLLLERYPDEGEIHQAARRLLDAGDPLAEAGRMFEELHTQDADERAMWQ